MGIYYDGNVYGIGWELYDYENMVFMIKFEKRTKNKMTMEELQEVKIEYNKLMEEQKEECDYYVITECSTTYNLYEPALRTKYGFARKRLERLFLNGYDNDRMRDDGTSVRRRSVAGGN
jgi:hypothetical protein